MADLKRISTPYSYSQAVAAGDFIFLGIHSGQGVDFAAQFDDALKKMAKSLTEFGLTLNSLVKMQVWLKDIKDLPEVEKRVRSYFEKDKYPVRMTSTTQFIDEGRLVMLEGVAYRK